MIIQLVRAVSVICGIGLLLGGILRFIEYRRNPVVVRLSMVVFMFLFGAALVIVGLIPLIQASD
jgi:fumarate reductase subunit C